MGRDLNDIIRNKVWSVVSTFYMTYVRVVITGLSTAFGIVEINFTSLSLFLTFRIIHKYMTRTGIGY